MNKFIKKSILVAGGVALALTATVGFSAFKHVEEENINSEKDVTVLVNPQWFTYDADPNSPNFATEKLNPANYTPTGNAEPSERPCNDESEFCGIYAETTMAGAQQQPDLSSSQPVHSALNSYSNGDGPSELIDEKQPE